MFITTAKGKNRMGNIIGNKGSEMVSKLAKKYAEDLGKALDANGYEYIKPFVWSLSLSDTEDLKLTLVADNKQSLISASKAEKLQKALEETGIIDGENIFFANEHITSGPVKFNSVELTISNGADLSALKSAIEKVNSVYATALRKETSVPERQTRYFPRR